MTIICLILVQLFNNTTRPAQPRIKTVVERCIFDSSAPAVLYNLKTSLGVSYDAGHWFHMAENFMVHHSILRASSGQSNISEIYYNFDNPEFVGSLNGMTRL